VNADATARYAVIGRSADQPLLYHMDLPRERAERLRERRELSTGQPCYVVTMAAWHADPMGALRGAEAARRA
jgi:hypothetical protein